MYHQVTYTPQGGTELSTPQGGTELSPGSLPVYQG